MQLSELLNTLTERLSSVLPDAPGLLKKDLQKNFHAVLQATFSRLALMTREEFDIQAKVLARCQMRIAALEVKVQTLESEKCK